MRVIVMTSDKYLDALRPFAWLFNKYWSPEQEVLVAGFTPPEFDLPDNFSFHSIGKFEDYPWSKWSDALLDLFEQIDDEVFALMLEDYWLTRPVDVGAVQILYDYMMQFRYVLKMDLCADRLYAMNMQDYGTAGRVDLVKSDYNSPYHMSLMTGLWNRDLMSQAVVRGWSAHDVELSGTERLKKFRDKMLVLGTRQWPVRHTLAFRAQDPTALKLDDLQVDDVKELRNLGFLEPWGLESHE